MLQALTREGEGMMAGPDTVTGPDTQFVAEPGTHEMIVTAVIDGPREAVYRAHTEPDLIAQWWGPAELTTTIDKCDVTTGGAWRNVHTDPGGNEYAFRGVYHEVVPSERIVGTFEFEGMPGHVSLATTTFEDVDGKTKVTQHTVFQSVEDRDGMADTGAREFAPVGMAQLAEVVRNL